jgi:hypothetical protein
MDFKRPLSQIEAGQWEELPDLVEQVRINGDRDRVAWVLEKSGKYTSRSMYRFLSHRGVVNRRMRHLWKSRLPMKIKVFLWLAFQDRIQSGVALGGDEVERESQLYSMWGTRDSRPHPLWMCFGQTDLGWPERGLRVAMSPHKLTRLS